MKKFVLAHRAALLRIMSIALIVLPLFPIKAYIENQRFEPQKYSFENGRGIPVAGLNLTSFDIVKSYFYPNVEKSWVTVFPNVNEDHRFYYVKSTPNGIKVECHHDSHGITPGQDHFLSTAGDEVFRFVLLTLVGFLIVLVGVSFLIDPLGTLERMKEAGNKEVSLKLLIPDFLVFRKKTVQ